VFAFTFGKSGPFRKDENYSVRAKWRLGKPCPGQQAARSITEMKVKKNKRYTLAIDHNDWNITPGSKATLKISGTAKLKKDKKKKKR